MDERFRHHLDAVVERYDELVGMPPAQFGALPRGMPRSGVYMFSEAGQHLYVGRTRRLRARIRQHVGPAMDAPFAFRLAREAVGATHATYRPEGSRRELVADPDFRMAMAEAKARIRLMDVRWVEAADPITQAILEMYAAVLVDSPYNDFKTT